MSTKIKGYIIDPETNLITPVKVDAHHLIQYRHLIKCERLQPALVFNNNRLWTDATAIYGKSPFLICDRDHDPSMAFGRSLILGYNGGRCVSFHGTITDVAKHTYKIKEAMGDGEQATVVVDENDDTFDFSEPLVLH